MPIPRPRLAHHTDTEIAEALGELSPARLEAVTRLVIARMGVEARGRLLAVALAAPAIAGAVAGRAVEGALLAALKPRRG